MKVKPNASEQTEIAVARVASCLAEPARARILCCLMDGRGRTATELASVAEVGASTTSSHLAMLSAHGLVNCTAQGRYRYYSLANKEVGTAVESLLVLTGSQGTQFVPSTPQHLRQARRCYDHLAGYWGVRLHDHAIDFGWLVKDPRNEKGYIVTETGSHAFESLGVDVSAAKSAKRRHLACHCMDWSERRPHLGGALGAALLKMLIDQKWFIADLDTRELHPTKQGLLALIKLLGD